LDLQVRHLERLVALLARDRLGLAADFLRKAAVVADDPLGVGGFEVQEGHITLRKSPGLPSSGGVLPREKISTSAPGFLRWPGGSALLARLGRLRTADPCGFGVGAPLDDARADTHVPLEDRPFFHDE